MRRCRAAQGDSLPLRGEAEEEGKLEKKGSSILASSPQGPRCYRLMPEARFNLTQTHVGLQTHNSPQMLIQCTP